MTLAPTGRPNELDAHNLPPLTGYNAFTSHRVHVGGIQREGAAVWADRLAAFGEVVGAASTRRRVDQAHRDRPRLRRVDRDGRGLDLAEFHPGWHDWLAIAVGNGAHRLSRTDCRPGIDERQRR